MPYIRIAVPPKTEEVLSIAVTPDGRRIVSGSGDYTLSVWDGKKGRKLHTMKGHPGPVVGVLITPDGRRVISWSLPGVVKVWDAENGQELPFPPGRCRFGSENGRRILVEGNDGKLAVWDTDSLQKLYTLEGHSGEVDLTVGSLDGLYLVTSGKDQMLKVWDVDTGTLCLTSRRMFPSTSAAFVTAGARFIVCREGDESLAVWDIENGMRRHSLGHPRKITALAASPDGRRIVSAGLDQRIRVWDLESGTELCSIRSNIDVGHVNFLAVTTDGNYVLSGSFTRQLKAWDIGTGEMLGCFPAQGGIGCIATQDHLIAAGGDFGMLYLLVLEDIDVKPRMVHMQQISGQHCYRCPYCLTRSHMEAPELQPELVCLECGRWVKVMRVD